jgi:site-specific recombinase XerD
MCVMGMASSRRMIGEMETRVPSTQSRVRGDLTPYSSPQPKLFEESDQHVDLGSEALQLRKRATPKNTASAYKIAWDAFSAFCADPKRGYRRLPASPKAVAEYLAYLHAVKSFATSTIKQHKAAIRHYHRLAGHLDPCRDPLVTDVWRGILIEADQGEPQVTYALWRRSVEAVVDKIDDEVRQLGKFAPAAARLTAVRDRALVLVLSSSARLTTREIHSLRTEEIVQRSDGLDIRVQRSPDAFGKPRITTIKAHRGRYCPVEALGDWLRAADLDRDDQDGAVFRPIQKDGKLGRGAISPSMLLRIVKRRCALAGIDPRLITMRALRSGSMMQGGYDGEAISEVLDAAGLSPESKPRIASLVGRGRSLRERNEKPPDGVDVVTVGAARLLTRPRP